MRISLLGLRGLIMTVIGLLVGFAATMAIVFDFDLTAPAPKMRGPAKPVLLEEDPNSTPSPATHLQFTSVFPDHSLGFTPDSKNGSEFPSLQYAKLLTDFSSDAAESPQWIEDRVQKGDTFVKISLRNGLSYQQALNVANTRGAEILHQIKPGRTIRFQLDSEQGLRATQYTYLPLETLEISRDKRTGDYQARILNHTPEIRVRSFTGPIESSLFQTAKSNNIPYSIINQLIDAYQWKIDFYRDIKKRDEFSIVYEELFKNGNRIGAGRLTAAMLDLSGDRVYAIRYTDPDGHTDYYSPDGKSLSVGFLRSPLKFAAISSHFSPRRLHPITKEWKPHRGVDYSAPLGTPVMSTGDGQVTEAKFKNGYGITVVIKHSDKYKSLYAHLSKIAKGVRPGTRVKQGDVIGYVGSTGNSTGPHLHYEFQIDGVHQDAVTVKLPNAKQVSDRHMPQFSTLANGTLQKLSSPNPIQVASN